VELNCILLASVERKQHEHDDDERNDGKEMILNYASLHAIGRQNEIFPALFTFIREYRIMQFAKGFVFVYAVQFYA
jgi:hypothetical protein